MKPSKIYICLVVSVAVSRGVACLRLARTSKFASIGEQVKDGFRVVNLTM